MKDVSIIPEVTVHDARAAIEFYKKAFGAKDLGTHATPDGKKVMHSALELNGGVVFVCDDFPEMRGGKSSTPKALGGSPITIHLDCADVDSMFERAVKAGATVTMPLADQFWGDRYGQLRDPFGHHWSLATRKRTATKADLDAGATGSMTSATLPPGRIVAATGACKGVLGSSAVCGTWPAAPIDTDELGSLGSGFRSRLV